MEPRYLNAKQAAAYLGMTERAVYVRVHRHAIPFLKVGRMVRFDVQALDLWMKGRTVSALMR